MLVVVRELDTRPLVEEAGVDAGLEFGAALGLEIGIARTGLHDARTRATGGRDERERRIGSQRGTRTWRPAGRSIGGAETQRRNRICITRPEGLLRDDPRCAHLRQDERSERLAEGRIAVDARASLQKQHLAEAHLLLRQQAQRLRLGVALMRFAGRRRGDEIGGIGSETDADACEDVLDGIDVLTAEGEVGRDLSRATEARVNVAEVIDRVDVNRILHVLDISVGLIAVVPTLAVLREERDAVRRRDVSADREAIGKPGERGVTDLRRWCEANGRQLVLDRLQSRDRRTEPAAPSAVRPNGDAEDVGQGVLLREISIVGVVTLRQPVVVAADANRSVDA